MALTQHELLQILERQAPLARSEEWDNTGLLLDPAPSRAVHRLLLTIDLTSPVLDEAIRKKVDFILAYHPPIFSGLKRLTSTDPKTRLLLRCLSEKIPVYSPHTALDSAKGGMADWLAGAFDHRECRVIGSEGLGSAYGPGRWLRLARATQLQDLAEQLKAYASIPYFRHARPPGRTRAIQTVALCPGAGSSLLQSTDADLIITGEMRHHDALAFTASGSQVLISEHSLTERGFLPVFAEQLTAACKGSLRVLLSKKDRDPFELLSS